MLYYAQICFPVIKSITIYMIDLEFAIVIHNESMEECFLSTFHAAHSINTI